MSTDPHENKELPMGDDENPVVWLLGLAAEIADWFPERTPLRRNHARQRCRTHLLYFVWGLATCGLGWVLLLPSYVHWRLEARRAFRAGRMVRPW